MKTKEKSKAKRTASHGKATRGRKANGPGKSIEDRDLNEDEQDQITNVNKDDDLAGQSKIHDTGFTVEEEEEREKKRKLEDRHPEDLMK